MLFCARLAGKFCLSAAGVVRRLLQREDRSQLRGFLDRLRVVWKSFKGIDVAAGFKPALPIMEFIIQRKLIIFALQPAGPAVLAGWRAGGLAGWRAGGLAGGRPPRRARLPVRNYSTN